ncbi:MAG: alpha/beta fold hydrolase [bacterium]|nr:alpha/beta fold hydrolase [bacterium]
MRRQLPVVVAFCVLLLAAAACTPAQRSALAPADAPAAVPTSHPVSLLSLRAKPLDGGDFKLGRVISANAAYTRYYVTYRSGELKISGIMNVPSGKGPYPLLLLNHGYIDPAVYTNGRGLKREQDYLARAGYVVLHSDYRNHADSDRESDPEQRFRMGYAEDVMNAIAAVRAADLPFVDASRVGMLGHSMGGGVTLQLMAAKPDLITAAVLFAPVSGDARDNFERWTTSRPSTTAQIIAAYGRPEDNPAFWDNLSPLTYVNEFLTPVQIHHGTVDNDVPISWSDRLYTRLQAAGKESQFFVYRGEPHEFINAWPTVMRRTTQFFDVHVKATTTPSAVR